MGGEEGDRNGCKGVERVRERGDMLLEYKVWKGLGIIIRVVIITIIIVVAVGGGGDSVCDMG